MIKYVIMYMKDGDNMEIYKGYYSDKKYQFIYNIEDIKKIGKPIFDEYKVNHVLLNEIKEKALKNAEKEFLQFNICEGKIENVY